MSEHYHDAGDVRLLNDMHKLAPKDFEAWLASIILLDAKTARFPRSTAN